MAGTKDTSKSERNRRICLLRRNGFTYGEIATMEQISRPRVAQIVKEHNEELGEDEGRAEVASLLEFVERRAVGLINDPGPLMGPNGRPAVDPEGEPVPNNGIVVEGLKILLLVGEKKPRLFGWEKQQRKQTPQDRAMEEMLTALAAEKARFDAGHLSAAERRELEASRRELEEFRQRFGSVVPGEVVRELPPGGA